MVKMNKDFTIYLPNDSEFTFRRGYSYLCDKSEADGIEGEKMIVYSVDRLISMELDEEDMEWIEEV